MPPARCPRMAYTTREPAITDLDILAAAELALPHRLKRQPFQDTENRLEELSSRMEEARQEADRSQSPMAPRWSSPRPEKKRT